MTDAVDGRRHATARKTPPPAPPASRDRPAPWPPPAVTPATEGRGLIAVEHVVDPAARTQASLRQAGHVTAEPGGGRVTMRSNPPPAIDSSSSRLQPSTGPWPAADPARSSALEAVRLAITSSASPVSNSGRRTPGRRRRPQAGGPGCRKSEIPDWTPDPARVRPRRYFHRAAPLRNRDQRVHRPRGLGPRAPHIDQGPGPLLERDCDVKPPPSLGKDPRASSSKPARLPRMRP